MITKAISALVIIESPFKIAARPLSLLSGQITFLQKGRKFLKNILRYIYCLYLSKNHTSLCIAKYQMYSGLMDHFPALFCYIIWWTYQLSIIKGDALQFTCATSGQAIRSAQQMYIYSMIAMYIEGHQSGFCFQKITNNSFNVNLSIPDYELK